ncbi:MAG: hypothetical protein QGI60_01165 [archaeon]|nr:hypothetical protein [archaeon]
MRAAGPEPGKKPKQTVNTINVGPTKTREIRIRGRAKPRKARLAIINQFNALVKSGLCSGLQFNEFGALTGVEQWNRRPTPAEQKVFRQVVRLTHELTHRLDIDRSPTFKRTLALDKLRKAMAEHKRRGQFEYTHHIIDQGIVSGGPIETYIQNAEKLNGRKLPSLRKYVKRFDTPKKVKANLKRQLTYFGQVLKDRKLNELIIDAGETQWDGGITKIKFTEEGIIRETKTEIVVHPFTQTTQLVILKPNGKIEFRESTIDLKQSDSFDRRGGSRRR